MADAFHNRLGSKLSFPVRTQIEWAAAEVDASPAFLADAPTGTILRVGGAGDVLSCHATPRSDEEIFTAEELRRVLKGSAKAATTRMS